MQNPREGALSLQLQLRNNRASCTSLWIRDLQRLHDQYTTLQSMTRPKTTAVSFRFTRYVFHIFSQSSLHTFYVQALYQLMFTSQMCTLHTYFQKGLRIYFNFKTASQSQMSGALTVQYIKFLHPVKWEECQNIFMKGSHDMESIALCHFSQFPIKEPVALVSPSEDKGLMGFLC